MFEASDLTIILAAGKSPRVSHLTFDRPKALLSVGGQSLLLRLCLMFAPVTRKFAIVAGQNRQAVEAHLAGLDLDIEIIGDEGVSDNGSAASLKAGLSRATDDYAGCHILAGDVLLSEPALDAYLASTRPARTLVVPVRDDDDDKLFLDPAGGEGAPGISKTPPAGAEIVGKLLGITRLPVSRAKVLARHIPGECHSSYTAFLPQALGSDLHPVILKEGLAAEIDTGDDYKRALLDAGLSKHISAAIPCFQPPGHLSLRGPVKRLVGVHDALGSHVTQRCGFDGLWLGSFQISLSNGGRDDASYDPTTALQLAEQLVRSGNRLPVVVDAGNGFATRERTTAFVERAAAARVAAVCVEDNDAERICSLYGAADRQLVSVEAFGERIREFVQLAAGRMQIFARTEALTIGLSEQAAAERLEAAAAAGASALLPHYVGEDAATIRGFLERHPQPLPVLLVPTGLLDLPLSEFAAMGCAAVVYANLDIRLRFERLRQVYARLAAEARLAGEIRRELADPAEMRKILAD